MKNFVSKSNIVTVVSPKNVFSGVPFLFGGFVAFPETDANQGELVAVVTEGVVNVILNSDVNFGDVLYLHPDGTINKTSTNGNILGFSLEAGLNGTEIRCMLNKTISSSASVDLSSYLKTADFNKTLIAACTDASVKAAIKTAATT